ncbi:MAG: hypothetical protein JKY52_13090 [Flavobacteriales bacterium]|nr:hypothetical protein [Flavobacteriales bacterium]
MTNIKLLTFSFVLCGLSIGLNGFAQCKSDAENVGRPFYELETECAKANSEPSYLTDGKDYRSLLTNNSVEHVVVFYANNQYRISACTDVGGPLSFTVKDHKNNTLFSNKDYENAPYWDLAFPTTIECIVTVSLPDETKALAFGDGTAAESNSAPADSTVSESEGHDEGEGHGGKHKTEIKPVCGVLIIGYKQEKSD